MITALKTLWNGVSATTKRFIGVRLMYVVIGVLVAHLIFVDKGEKVIVQAERDEYRDSLVVVGERLRIMKEVLIFEVKRNEKDSLNLRGYNVDSLIIYVSALQVVARASEPN